MSNYQFLIDNEKLMFWRTSKFARAWNLSNDEKLDLQQATWVFLLENIKKLDCVEEKYRKSAMTNLVKESCRNWIFKNKGFGSKTGREMAMTQYDEVKEDMTMHNPTEGFVSDDLVEKLRQVGLHILTKDQYLSLFDEDQIEDKSRQAKFDLRNNATKKMKQYLKDNWK